MGKNFYNKRNKSNEANKTTKKGQKTDNREAKFAPPSEENRLKYQTYASVKDALELKIQEKFEWCDDLVETIRDEEIIDMGKLEPTIDEAKVEKMGKIAQQTAVDRYKREITYHEKRSQRYKNDLSRVFQMIISDFCTPKMKKRLEAHPEWKAKIRGDPVKTLKVIKGMSLAPVRAQYDEKTTLKIVKEFLTIKQRANEDFEDFSKRFSQAYDVFVEKMGKSMMFKKVSETDEYAIELDDKLRNEMVEDAFERFCAFLLLEAVDQNKYGSIQKNLDQRFSLGHDDYPKTMLSMADVLHNASFDQKYYDVQKKNREKENKKKQNDKKESTETSFKQSAVSGKKGAKDVQCFKCGEKGHYANQCKKNVKQGQWFAQESMVHVQSESDEVATPKSEPKTQVSATTKTESKKFQWTGLQGFQVPMVPVADNDNRQPVEMFDGKQDGDGEGKFDYLKKMFILDSGSTIAGTIQNADFVYDVRESESPIMMKTNAGAKLLSVDAELGGFGTVKFDPEQMANILALYFMADKYRITADTAVEQSVVVHTEKGPMKYVRINNLFVFDPYNPNGLQPDTPPSPPLPGKDDHDELGEEYFYKPRKTGSLTQDVGVEQSSNGSDANGGLNATRSGGVSEIVDESTNERKTGKGDVSGDSGKVENVIADVTTVSESSADDFDVAMKSAFVLANYDMTVSARKGGFTARECERAEKARIFYHALGCPALRDFKMMLNLRGFLDCDVTSADADLAEKIYGPDIARFKGRVTRKRPSAVVEDDVIIPDSVIRTDVKLILELDMFFINRDIVFLTAIDNRFKYRSAVYVPNKTAEEIYKALDKVLRVYNAKDLTIKEIRCDLEFQPLMDPVCDDMGIKMEYAPVGDHVPGVERNNRVIGETVRSLYHMLPYKNMPKVMWQYVGEVAAWLRNLIPASNGVSEFWTPFTIMHGKFASYEKHLKIPFGTYVQANQENTQKNSMAARALDAIYLRPRLDRQGGHEVLNLNTGKVIVRPRVWRIPITDRVIKAVNRMGRRDKMREMKLTAKNDVLLFPADWIAGVHHDMNDGENTDSEDESYGDSDDDDYDSDDEQALDGNRITEEELADIMGDQQEVEHPDVNEDEESNPSDSESDDDGGYEYEDMPALVREDEDDDVDALRQVTPERNVTARSNVAGDNQGLISPGWSDSSNVSTPMREIGSVEEDSGPDTVDRVFEGVREILDEGQELTGFREESATDDVSDEDDANEEQQVRRSVRESVVPNNLTYDAEYEQQGYQNQETSFYMDDHEGIEAHLDEHWKVFDEENKKWMTPEVFRDIMNDENVKVIHQEYSDDEEAMMAAKFMVELHENVQRNGTPSFLEMCFGQQYVLPQGIKKFGPDAIKAAERELDQLHKRNCFSPVDRDSMTEEELEREQPGIMLVTEKEREKDPDKRIKGRFVYDGSGTRDWISREDAASPTVSMESLVLTSVIDAKEERDEMTADVPNAFIQANMPEIEDGKERVIMKITGVMVDILIKLAPEVYKKFVILENGKKVLHVQVLKALYGMLVAALLWYKRLRDDLEEIGFVFNPYDPCVANRMIRDKQQTVCFHVDDLKSSHVMPEVNDEFLVWLNEMYGKVGEVKATRGKVHDYLGMTLDFTNKGMVEINMCAYVDKVLCDFREMYKLDTTAETPAANDLFAKKGDELLDVEQREHYHTFVAKCLFMAKRGRPDIQMAIAVLATRVREPTKDDWKKLVRVMRYLNGTRKLTLKLKADDLHVIRWYVDASFAVHPDFKSHTGYVMTMGKGAIQSGSSKQKLNSRSSCEAELIGADDAATKILWTKFFLEAQGYAVRKNLLYQDNKSTMLLLKNGKRSSGKRTRALDIRYFFLHDQQEKGNVSVEYCPTKEMIGDFYTKPKQGKEFRKFRDLIMGLG